MEHLVVEFRDFPNSLHTIRRSLSRAKGRGVCVAVDHGSPRPAKKGRTVGFIDVWARENELTLARFSEQTPGVYRAEYKSAELLQEEERLLAEERNWKAHQEARWAQAGNVYDKDAGRLKNGRQPIPV